MMGTAADYEPLPGCYDEMVDQYGAPRPHWEPLVSAFTELGTGELLRRRGEASRLLDQDGVIYNAYRPSGHTTRRWLLDPVPTVVSSREWEAIETGVIERAELLNLILEDLYGPRELLRRGLLPRRARARPRRFPAPVRPDPAAESPAAVQLCGRHRPRSRRALGRHQRPRTGAVRLGLRAREPDRHLARAAESLPRTPRSTGSRPSSAPCAPPCRRSRLRPPTTRGSSC